MSDNLKNKKSQNRINYVQSYRNMLFWRLFEQSATKLYSVKLIKGFCHVYMGQEDILESIMINTSNNDPLITTYRCHAHALARSQDGYSVMSELLGKSTGSSKGKGGSMHLFDLKNKFFGGHGIVGASVSIGTGLAFAEKYNNTNNICICCFGDGALNQGQTFESINMASLWDLPIVYILENNEYSMGTKNSDAIANYNDIKKRFEAFNIKSFNVKSGDINVTEKTVHEAINYTRKNKKPSFIEIKTYRFKGHSLSDPATYRTKDEVKKYKDNSDPVNNLKNFILKSNIISSDEIKSIDKEIELEMEKIVEFAKTSDLPSEASLYEDVI